MQLTMSKKWDMYDMQIYSIDIEEKTYYTKNKLYKNENFATG